MMNECCVVFDHKLTHTQCSENKCDFLLIVLDLFIKLYYISFIGLFTYLLSLSLLLFLFLQAAVVEMTWVISDYTATPGTNEVSVTNRQQVEIIDTNCKGAPEYCLVRLNGNAADGSGTLEGLVPVSILKPAPSSKIVHRRAIDGGADNKDTSENNGECGKTHQHHLKHIFDQRKS